MITVSYEDRWVAQVGGFPCFFVLHNYLANEILVKLASGNEDFPSALGLSHPLLPLFIREVRLFVSNSRWTWLNDIAIELAKDVLLKCCLVMRVGKAGVLFEDVSFHVVGHGETVPSHEGKQLVVLVTIW